jgi:hypothetical protein
MLRSEISKGQLIRAAACLPVHQHEAILSDPVQTRAKEKIEQYEKQDGGPWDYRDIPHRLKELYKAKDLEAFVKGLHAKCKPEEAKAKEFIFRYVSECLPLEQHTVLDAQAPPRPLEGNVDFKAPFDVVLQSTIGFHWVFVLPHSSVVLKESQRQRLLYLLAEPVPGYGSTSRVEYFEFPKFANRREREHKTVEMDYLMGEDSEMVLEHFIRFHLETLQVRSRGQMGFFDV